MIKENLEIRKSIDNIEKWKGEGYIEGDDIDLALKELLNNSKRIINDIGIISSFINTNFFDEIKNNLKTVNSIELHSWISLTANEFLNKYSYVKNYEWEDYCLQNGFSDYEEVIFMFVSNKLKSIL